MGDDPPPDPLHAARRVFNLGTKLCRVGDQVHAQLVRYLPPHNGTGCLTPERNGVSYRAVFETEYTTFRDAQRRLCRALDQAQALGDARLRKVAEHNLQRAEAILVTIELLRTALAEDPGEADELALWLAFVEDYCRARSGE